MRLLISFRPCGAERFCLADVCVTLSSTLQISSAQRSRYSNRTDPRQYFANLYIGKAWRHHCCQPGYQKDFQSRSNACWSNHNVLKSLEDVKNGTHRHRGPLTRRFILLRTSLRRTAPGFIYFVSCAWIETVRTYFYCYILSCVSLTEPHVEQAMEMETFVDSPTNGEIPQPLTHAGRDLNHAEITPLRKTNRF